MDFKRLIEERVEAERAKRRRLQAQEHSAVAMATNASHVTVKQEEGAAVAMDTITPHKPVIGAPEDDELILSTREAIKKPRPIDFGSLRAGKRKTKGMLLN
jgi:hypothetical protein